MEQLYNTGNGECCVITWWDVVEITTLHLCLLSSVTSERKTIAQTCNQGKILENSHEAESRYSTYWLGTGNPVRKFHFWQIACIQTNFCVMDFDGNTRANQDYFVQYTCTSYEPTVQSNSLISTPSDEEKKREKCVSFERVEKRKIDSINPWSCWFFKVLLDSFKK